VEGQGNPKLDVAAVQAAVDMGGRVTLVGTFDFGPTGQVIIGKDVTITGRRGAIVRGGTVTFLSPLPALSPLPPGPAIVIEDLTFDGATLTPIRIAYARSVKIQHLTVRNVLPFWSPPIGQHVQVGISVSTQAYSPAVVPGAITGRIRIRNNDLEMTSPVAPTTVCVGAQIMRGWGVDAEISHNTVVNCARNGIEALDNSLDGSGVGRIRVSHNRVRSATVGSPWPVPFRPNGIVVGWFFFPAGSVDPLRNPAYEVSENDIDVAGGSLAGIFANAGGVVIEENRIAVSGAGAMGVTLASANGLVKENRIGGAGVFGIRVAPFFPSAPSVVADGNTLLCNDLGGFQAGVADVSFAGSHNTAVGAWHSLLDTGVGNEAVPSGRCEDGEH
jgi:hypothetical protein